MKLLQKKQKMYLVPRYVYVGTYVPGLHPPPKKITEGLLMKLLKKNKIKNNNLNTELKEMGVFSAVAGKITKSIANKSTTGSLPLAVPLAMTPTFSPWTHTSDDSYIYQLSLVLATAIVSCVFQPNISITENHSNQDPRYSQKTIYYAILANQIWSWILCSPVVGKSLTPNYRWVQTYLPCVADVHHEAMIDDRWSVGCAKRSCEYLPLKRTILYDPTSKHTEGKHLSFPSSLLRIS